MASVAVAPQCDPPGLFFRSEFLLHRRCRSSHFVCNFADVRSPCRISAAKCARRLSVQAFAGRDDPPDSPSKCVDVAEGPTEMENVGTGLRSRSRSVKGNSEYVRSKASSKTSLRSLSGFDWIRENNRKLGAILSDVEAEFFKCISHIGECMAPIIGSGFILGTALNVSGGDCQLDMLVWSGWLVGILAGIMIGTNQVLERRCKSGTQNVVITGSTRGLGKALAREFLFAGDNVVVASRSAEFVRETVAQLHQELTEGLLDLSSTSAASCKERGKVIGIPCDVSKAEDVKELAKFAISELGSIDIWINNAGTNKGFKPLLQISDEDINQIVSTNLVGSIICTKEAIRVMKLQEQGGHVFNMDGAGSGGSSTPLTAVYGSTKCGLRQLNSSLLEECRRSTVGIHTASPGMVLTDLLLSGSTIQNKKAFNIICELPETVARALVPRMRAVKGTGKAINYLTPPRILLALITAWVRRGRWFDEQGRALFAAEADRVRNWAENRARFSISDAMDIYSDGSWVSVFSFSVVCAFILLSSSAIDMPGS